MRFLQRMHVEGPLTGFPMHAHVGHASHLESHQTGPSEVQQKTIVAVMRQMAIRVWHVAQTHLTSAEWITLPPGPTRWLNAPPAAAGTNAT